MLNGVTFRGRSDAYHGIDVAIVPASVATKLRKSGGGSPLGRPRISVECKDVGTNGSVDEMRTFVARLYDLTLLCGHHTYLPRAHHRYPQVGDPPRTIHPGAPPEREHRPVVTYRHENQRTLNVLARRTGFVKGALALSEYHAVVRHGRVTVQSPSADQLMSDVAEWIVRKGY